MQISQKKVDFFFEILFASIPVIIFFGLLIFTTATIAAPTVDVEQEIEQTEMILQDVEDDLPDNPPSQIIEQLSIARGMQADAYSAFARNEFMLALHMTMQAREIGRRVEAMMVKMVNGQTQVPEALLRLLEGNAEMIDELTPSVDEYGDEVSRTNFAAAIDLHKETWVSFNGGDYDVAGRLGRIVKDKLTQVSKAIVVTERRYDNEYVRAEFDRTADLLSRAEDKIPEGAVEAMELLRTAKDMFAESEVLIAKGRSNEASRVLQEVVAITQRAARLSEKRGLRSTELLETLARTDDYLDVAHTKVQESGRKDAMDIMRRAEDMQAEAKHALNIADNAKAEKLTLDARRIAELAVRTTQDVDEIEFDKVQSAIIKTDDLIASKGSDIERSGSEAAMVLLRRAEQYQTDAGIYLIQKKYKEALTSTRAASESVLRAAKAAGLE
jgi:hypothetical protein